MHRNMMQMKKKTFYLIENICVIAKHSYMYSVDECALNNEDFPPFNHKLTLIRNLYTTREFKEIKLERFLSFSLSIPFSRFVSAMSSLFGFILLTGLDEFILQPSIHVCNPMRDEKVYQTLKIKLTLNCNLVVVSGCAERNLEWEVCKQRPYQI